jgi:hypothetical protein
MDSERIGNGGRQTDRQITGEQQHIDDAESPLYGISYALVTTPKTVLE